MLHLFFCVRGYDIVKIKSVAFIITIFFSNIEQSSDVVKLFKFKCNSLSFCN